MPTVNAAGDIIPDLELTEQEKARIRYLQSLTYPEYEWVIFRMAPNQFKEWLHLQNPKEALILCSTQGISGRVAEQLNPKLWKRIKDSVWRVFH